MPKITVDSSEIDTSEVMNRASRLLAVAAHDLRGPIGAVAGLAEMTLDLGEGTLNRLQRENLGMIAQRCGEMFRLVEDLLAFDRIRTGLPCTVRSVVDVNQLRLSVEATLAREVSARGVQLVWRGLDQSAPMVWADREQLRRWIINLVTNSLRATPAGGRITVYLVANNLPSVRLGVRDTGAGFTAEQLQEVVKTGRSSREGLGISICRQIASLHHSWLWLNSESGVGTCFEMFLPTVSPAAVASAFAKWRSGNPAAADHADGFVALPGEDCVPKTQQITFQSLTVQLPDLLLVDRLPDQIDRLVQSDLQLHELAYRASDTSWFFAWDEILEHASDRQVRMVNRLLPLLQQAGMEASAMHWSNARSMDAAAGVRSPIVDAFVRGVLELREHSQPQHTLAGDESWRYDAQELRGATDQNRVNQRLNHELRQIAAHFRSRQNALAGKAHSPSRAVPAPLGIQNRSAKVRNP